MRGGQFTWQEARKRLVDDNEQALQTVQLNLVKPVNIILHALAWKQDVLQSSVGT